MFRESATARTMLRAGVVAAIAVLASLKASIGDGLDAQEWVDMVAAGIGSLAVYLGIGAAVPAVEPFFGNEMDVAPVPSPPAVDETP